MKNKWFNASTYTAFNLHIIALNLDIQQARDNLNSLIWGGLPSCKSETFINAIPTIRIGITGTCGESDGLEENGDVNPSNPL